MQQVSKSVFVTNFPNHFSFRDLWRVCDEYGKVIDVFILNKRSKVGKRYGFVFIWVGRLRLHANIVRFQRPPQKFGNTQERYDASHHRPSHIPMFKEPIMHRKSYASMVKNREVNSDVMVDSKPALLLDNSCILQRDFSLALMGKVKEFGSLTNLSVTLAKEGFEDLTLSYLGGFWVMIEFKSVIVKDKFHNHVGVGSCFSKMIQASKSFHIDERVAWVDIEGIPLRVWT